MSSSPRGNRVRERRSLLGLSQATLAAAAGTSRTTVTAIEGGRIVPSVAAALGIAAALDTTVESLFGPERPGGDPAVRWAWDPPSEGASAWEAEVDGCIVHYPATATPMLAVPADHRGSAGTAAHETLVLASCDPAAGLLAARYATSTGLRLLVLPRSSRAALAMLREGLVHLAGIHLASADAPQGNVEAVRDVLGTGNRLVHVAAWDEGIASAPVARVRSVGSVRRRTLSWVGREAGSGARICLDRLLEGRPAPRREARDHRGVADAVRCGWAEAGVCVRLAAAEAGLDFLPVQREAYDVAFAAHLADDRRVVALLSMIRSRSFRRELGKLPGYDTARTGETRSVR